MKPTTLWCGTSIAVTFCLTGAGVHLFLLDPAFRGRMIFMALLAAAVISGIGWMHSAQRAKAKEEADAVVTRYRRRQIGIVDR